MTEVYRKETSSIICPNCLTKGKEELLQVYYRKHHDEKHQMLYKRCPKCVEIFTELVEKKL